MFASFRGRSGYGVRSGYVGHECQVASVVRAGDGNEAAGLENMTNVVFPDFRILGVRVNFRDLRASFKCRNLVGDVTRLRIACARRATIFCVVLQVFGIGNVANV